MAGSGNISYRPVRAIGLLLAFQVVCLVALGAHEALQVDWRGVSTETAPSRQVIEAVTLALFIPGGYDADVGARLPPLAAQGVVAGGDLPGPEPGGLPVALLPAPAVVRLPDHGLLHPDDPLPQLPGRARRVPPAARRGAASARRRRVSADAEALLRRFEPVVRSTKGDKFYPMDVEPYVRACSLWVQRPGEEAVCVVPKGKLDLDTLAQQPLDEVGAVHFLKFTDPRDLARPGSRGGRFRVFGRRAARGFKESREAFRAGRGRLARVGYVSRFVDALYSITLLARGRVPGESAAAASVSYERIMEEGEHYRYHGRVVRQDGWVVLQYWLFYPFNDWRSGFFGANDHEADWEKIFVYLSESEAGEVSPEWVAYAAHNYTGDNLRRRWDDPEVEKVGEHAVIYVGAGSHASYYAPGEYLTELNIPLPAPLARTANAVRGFWKERLGQYAGEGEEEGGPGYLHIPFVDYARGDGLSIGAGCDRRWDPPRLMLDPPPRWVSGYRGLWGLYARDPFEGEDAPAGPMYNRDK